MRVALVTCRELPEPDHDERPLLDALRAAGVEAELVAWDGPAASLARFDRAVLRSCWNYYLEPERFVAWLGRAERETDLWNPARAVRWNLHKAYLIELAGRGLPIVPTQIVRRGERAALAEILERSGWEAAVVKPCVSAASYRTERFERADAARAQDFLDELAAERDAMVQRYLPGVETKGERALVWIDGAWTHAVRKAPRLAGDDEAVSGALEVEAEEIALGERALAGWEGELLYARLDVMPGDAGEVLVSELELIEPSLFLVQHPPALERFAAAIARA